MDIGQLQSRILWLSSVVVMKESWMSYTFSTQVRSKFSQAALTGQAKMAAFCCGLSLFGATVYFLNIHLCKIHKWFSSLNRFNLIKICGVLMSKTHCFPKPHNMGIPRWRRPIFCREPQTKSAKEVISTSKCLHVDCQ